MRLSQMFPKSTLDAADLAALNQGVTVVTIEKVDFQTFKAKRPGDAEIAYFLHVREFKKPFRMGKMISGQIAQVIGTDETDDWIGKTIGLRPLYQRFTDEKTGHARMVWIFDVDMVKPSTPPQLMPKQDITGLAASIKGGPVPGITAGVQSPQLAGAGAVVADASPMGVDKAAAMVSALRERGKTCDDLIKHLGNAGMSHLVVGKIPPDWPVSVIPATHGFCRMFPKSAAAASPTELEAIKQMWRPPASTAAPTTEVINKQTGEVISAGQSPVHIDEEDMEDIPF